MSKNPNPRLPTIRHSRTLFRRRGTFPFVDSALSSQGSARSTFPDMINFRIARLKGLRRVFAHAAPVFFERGIVMPETKVFPETLDEQLHTSPAVLCARYNDEEFFHVRCKVNLPV